MPFHATGAKVAKIAEVKFRLHAVFSGQSVTQKNNQEISWERTMKIMKVDPPGGKFSRKGRKGDQRVVPDETKVARTVGFFGNC